MIEAITPFIIVFAAAFALDFVWAKYTRYLADGVAFKASVWAAGTIVLGGVNQIGYTSNHWLLIPAALGCFVGTYVAVTRHKKETA